MKSGFINRADIMRMTVLLTILCLTSVSCGVVKPVQYTAHSGGYLPERVKFNLNHSAEELTELDKMKLAYFPGYYECDDSLLVTLLDSLIDSHLRCFAPSKLDPSADWEWYLSTESYFADYCRAKGELNDCFDFALADIAVEQMAKINFDSASGWQPAMNMDASVEGLLDFYRVHSMYDRLSANPQCSDHQRLLVLEDFRAWSRLNSAMYLLLSGYTAINASYSFAPVDFNMAFEDWSAMRVKELELEYVVLSGKRCRRYKNDAKPCHFPSLKSFYMENSDPFFIETIEQSLDDWMKVKEQIAQTMSGARQRQYRRLARKSYMRICNELEFMTKIWY